MEAVRHFKMSGGKPDDFARLPRGDKRRVAVAWALVRRTSLKQLWIAERLSMQTADNVSTQVRNLESEVEKKLPKPILQWMKKQ